MDRGLTCQGSKVACAFSLCVETNDPSYRRRKHVPQPFHWRLAGHWEPEKSVNVNGKEVKSSRLR